MTQDVRDLRLESLPIEALVDGVQLLRGLPRERARQHDALGQYEVYRAAHPEVDARLFIDRQPGHPEVDYDLYLQSDASGAIAVGWRPDRAMPWEVQYSEHWASSLVLSVNGRDLTVQEALQALRLYGGLGANLSTELVNFCIVDSAIIKDPPIVSHSELQIAADGFRAARGLYDAGATDRWLHETGLSIERFESLVKAAVQKRKLRDRITIHQVEAYFASHIESMAKVAVVRLHSASGQALESFALSTMAVVDLVELALGHQASIGVPGIRVVIETGLAEDVLPVLLPGPITTLPSKMIGPVRSNDGYCLFRVLRREPARLDKDTFNRVQDRLFASWLSAERAKAQISWHWM